MADSSKPRSLDDTVSQLSSQQAALVAKLDSFEDFLKTVAVANRLGSGSSSTLPPLLPTPVSVQRSATPITPVPSSFPIKQLTMAQMQERHDRGLCFNCDERFHRGHRCKAKFFLLIVDETTKEEASPELAVEPMSSDEHELAAISLHALFGQQSLSTIRLHSNLLGHPVEVLVDGGSTHNFLQERVALHLGIPITASPNTTVMIGNGKTLHCSGVCADVELILDGHKFLLDLFVLPIKGANLVLGTQWLSTLGPILMDYKAFTLSFTWQCNSLILHGKQRHLVEPTTSIN
ncbi:hypothetical protein Pint_29444 [Pistacia integerrima]|uniref:Uncharacterized protein n=1 Tax=Pistacia integerrima TaxID=434235 RepID=A0ACC0X402_9ROSI|nr:hypothetical protein Pint_29444 [Pistacia integerrima]